MEEWWEGKIYSLEEKIKKIGREHKQTFKMKDAQIARLKKRVKGLKMLSKMKKVDMVGMSIVNMINEINGVSVEQRQETNDVCFDFAYKQISDFLNSHFANVIGSWVSVKDRLPEQNQLCWIIYRATPNNRYYGMSYYTGKKFEADNVTHWMLPLPKPIDA